MRETWITMGMVVALTSPAAAQEIRPYGFVKASATATRGGVESYGRQNASAATAASSPIFTPDAGEWASTFQVAQSRAGLAATLDPTVTAKLEFDFINFDVASPTVQALVRLRIASVTWEFLEGQSLTVGQTWDLFSPMNTLHSNFVGNNFSAGNAGFMRHQAIWLGSWDGVFAGAAVGMPGANAGASIGALERSLAPSIAVLAGLAPSESLKIGVTAIAASRERDATNRTTSLGANLFAEYKTDALHVRAEGLWGQNLANLGTLTLGVRGSGDVQETGGWVSARYKFEKGHAIHGTFGGAVVLTPDTLAVGYRLDPDGVALRAGSGILSNMSARVGYEYWFAKKARLFFEPMLFRTEHKLLDPAQDGARLSLGVEAGVVAGF